ncbi:homoserine O-succinyltransferase MetA [Methylococcus geothermalis]|uniref:Homoserine O-succinyltransferase n=1 Tax=Methylococcus geothermalis TaxID=2681310 RepID=A0A858QAE6_9GAMM|nr:homoserine O-succinyltransferase [Methylococcus geothermalis]QJD30810.1 homoserine O-succinyltransferase [Methylococcus geothermalis]
MPLVAHTDLPTFQRLREEGQDVLSVERAARQDIREMHVGLLNMMPDAALEATERQFFRLVGGANPIVQFHMHPFTIDGLPRGEQAAEHIARYYESFDRIREEGLDGLIVSGANVTQPHLQQEQFWQPLTEVFDWARSNVTSILCSCLATHALFQYSYGVERTHLGFKRWGVYSHRVVEPLHPLVADINTRFDVPHSRYNEIFREDMEAAGLRVLVESEEAGVHLAVSPDLFRVVYFQAHPEYDTVSLLKEYKREILRYYSGEREDYPPFPEHYFSLEVGAALNDYGQALRSARRAGKAPPEFPEEFVLRHLDNTWRDTAKAVFNNWLGKIYQITDQDRRKPFMAHIDPDNPLGLA